MRADRLIMIILLLQTHQSMTAKSLAEKLEVSERTIYRDIDALTTLGVPVYTDRGRYGSIKLDGKFRTSLTGLNDNDIFYFSLPVPHKLINDLNIKMPNNSSFMKLLSTAPKELIPSLSDINNMLLIDMDSWSKETYQINNDLLKSIQNAIFTCSTIHISYDKKDMTKDYTLNPLSLVLKRTVWYLIAEDGDIIKNFRLDKIIKITLTDNSFKRPADYQLSEHWKGTVQSFRKTLPKYPIKVRVDHDIYPILKRRKTLRIVDEKEYILDILFDVKFEAMHFIFEWGNKIEVLEPKELIDELIEKSNEILNTYKS